MTENTFSVSEKFYSVQCEGHTTGYPAYFVRLKGCNLSCGLSTKHMREILQAGRNNTPPGDFIGDLHAEGSATWTCDTAPIWLFGDNTTYQDLIDSWTNEGVLEWIQNGRVHVIWTGGEPTIPKHQEAIAKFLELNQVGYSEIETNGTFYIKDELFSRLQQINCSAKLSNTGILKETRINPSAIKRIMEHSNYWFKFVVSNESDIQEIVRDYITPFAIPHDRVLMMPGLDSQENFHERTRFVLEMAKKYGYIGLTRLHVSAYDKTTGV